MRTSRLSRDQEDIALHLDVFRDEVDGQDNRDHRDEPMMKNAFSNYLCCSCMVLLCVGFTVWSVGEGMKLGAKCLDQFVAPGEVPVDSAESFISRLHNRTAMPQSCSVVVPKDMVENASVAQECLAWCRDGLGPGSGIIFAFSPLHWSYLKKTSSAVETSFKMCWKVETAAWALGLCPANWQMYLAACLYGSFSCMAFLCFLQTGCGEADSEGLVTEPECSRALVDPDSDDKDLDPVVTTKWCKPPFHEEFMPGGPFVATRRYKPPFCCISITSDHEGAKCQLRLSAFFMLLEPALDVLSVLMFLRRGQPIYAAVVGTSIVLACLLERDPFQIRGMRAMAQSLKRGFATQELYQIRMMELVESFGATFVQCYAGLRMDTSWASLSAVCTLLGGASISLAISIPDACRAVVVLLESSSYNDYYKQEEIKASVSFIGRYWPSVLCMALAELALVLGRHNDCQFSCPFSVVVGPPTESWDSFLTSLILLCFRTTLVSALLVAGVGCSLGWALLAAMAWCLESPLPSF